PAILAKLEAIRVAGALRMGLISSPEEAARRQHTPKVAFVAPPRDYLASSGKQIAAGDIDLNVRAMSMGKLHHAMMGTASVAIATAAAVPGTLVNRAAGGGSRDVVRFGHPSGTLRVGASVAQVDGQWTVTRAVMSRSARVLMEGHVRVPQACRPVASRPRRTSPRWAGSGGALRRGFVGVQWLLQFARPRRQAVVHAQCGDRRLAHRHRDLVESADHVAGRIESRHRGELARVHRD